MNLWSGSIPYYDKKADFIPALIPFIQEGTKAAVIVCAGGAYTMRAEHEEGKICEWLNSIGLSAFILQYRVAPYKAPAIPADAQRAIRLARKEALRFGIEKVGIMGFSAGGHLAAAASVHFAKDFYEKTDDTDALSARPDFTILCYPVIDMTDCGHEESERNLLGEHPSKEQRAFYSLQKQVTCDTPPAFLWHTADDSVVSVQNSLRYAEALSAHGISYELHIYPFGDHGQGLAQNCEYLHSWVEALERWLCMMKVKE